MERSVGTGTMRSQINAGKSNNTKIRQQQRTATSNRTGAMSSSAQTTSAHHRVIEKQRPKVRLFLILPLYTQPISKLFCYFILLTSYFINKII